MKRILDWFSVWADALRGKRGVRRYGAAWLYGALAGLAFPPFNAVAALWFCFPALAFLLQGAPDLRRAFAVGWSFAFGLLTVSLYWIAGALFVDLGSFWWAVPLAVFGLPALFALYYGCAAALAWRWGLGRLDGALLLALLWGAADIARGHLFTGFPWDVTGYVWGEVLPVLQLTSLVGVYGLSLLTLVWVLLPVTLVPPARGRRSVAWVAVSLLLLAGAAGWGAWRLAQAPTTVVPDVRLRLVQPNMDQAHKWRAEEREANFQSLLNLSFNAPGPVTHVIWPETAMAYYLMEDTPRRLALGAQMPEGATLLTGAVRRSPAAMGEWQYYNSLIAITKRGDVVAGYDKAHLVPFGEYMPFRNIIPIRAVAAMSDFSAGEGPRSLRVAGLPPFSPLICYEAIFPGAVTDDEDRPQFLLNVTNDAWYKGTTGPYQHFAISRVRAVEEGLPLVRVANKGVTAVVDPYGRIVSQMGWDKEGFIDSDLPTALPEATVYGQYRDWAALVIGGVVLAMVGVLRWLRRMGRA